MQKSKFKNYLSTEGITMCSFNISWEYVSEAQFPSPQLVTRQCTRIRYPAEQVTGYIICMW